MTLMQHSVKDLLAKFSSPSPTPGGGSASALAGAVGAALLAMVAGMQKTKNGTPDDREALDRAAEPLLNGRDHLADLVDRDSGAYEAVVAAYRLPKGTGDERQARSAAIGSALHGATEVPLDVMRACHAAAREAVVVATHGNPSAVSDAAVGMELLDAALKGAARNVRVNLSGIKNAGYVAGIEDEVRRLESWMADTMAAGRAALG